MTFTLVHRQHGTCWLHASLPVWIVHYPATDVRGEHWQAYRAVAGVPRGRMPWSVDNRRVGTERGFGSLGEAVRAGEMALEEALMS